MSKRREAEQPAAATSTVAPPPARAEEEPPITLGQKIFIVVLYLYVASLIWLVLSHHWYGVLPTWLDPH